MLGNRVQLTHQETKSGTQMPFIPSGQAAITTIRVTARVPRLLGRPWSVSPKLAPIDRCGKNGTHRCLADRGGRGHNTTYRPMSEEPRNFPFGGTVIATAKVASSAGNGPLTAVRELTGSLPRVGSATTTPNTPVRQPSFVEMAASFTASLAKFASSGFKTVDRESFRLRVEQASRTDPTGDGIGRICGSWEAGTQRSVPECVR